jgi:phosphatidate cytidylyltransferase
VSNLALRLLSAAFLIPFAITGIVVGGWVLQAQTFLVCLACLFEFAAVVAPKDVLARALFFIIGGVAMAVGALAVQPTVGVALMPLAFVALALRFVLKPYASLADTFNVWSRLSMGLLWIVPPLILVARLRDLGDRPLDGVVYGPSLLALCLVTTWANDSGAYFAGRFMGKHPMAGSISPKKTWEGFLGGILVALGFVLAMRTLFVGAFMGISVLDVVAVVIPVSILGPAGDLVESLWKRSYEIKDSGRLIPGHGGMLDRVDAVLFTAPWVYLYFTVLRP